ncbi:hypothetical protein G6F46_003982 [Rhizopus delemar]|uniref:Transposase Tc1-like domain-containing protein n=2 Tax=Rhizopus delemar TaxID=936053 RepID=I1C664_RHIO9|nr:hypothetical protein RO3G_08649 [Rhizopus delemar RA 99-880]KAG1496771.1 hypothetical protein G6F54_006236 [Rhizopus delemar]KAG1518451.1 hypothetical protein G6F53_000590 [Rhizopus delemar]KAG1560081.1 hypothetical protein G6F49_003010 [Rhizopus delemar]KAG1574794.1 hypothetical protein G6F50_001668 [Rhizopus delemar]|eukprot:EIE83944.1 hypothetical protein RO3G_08649 [Rhizopus delemar RA 99-880]
MSAQISKDCNRSLIVSEDETKRKTLRLYVDRLDFKSYRAAHKSRLTTRHRKDRLRRTKAHLNWTEDQWRSVAWSDESRFCVEGSKRGKRVLRKEGERYYERNIISTVKWGGGGAMVWGCFWGGGFGPLEISDTSSVDQETYFILGLQMSRRIKRGILSSKRMVLPVIQVVMLDGGRRPTKSGVLSTGLLKVLI